jgi:hypothetical protein
METAAATYSGSIEFLRGGVVESVRPCLCARCSVWALPRVYGRVVACVVDPADGRRYTLEHARPESVARIPVGALE